ncbi:MAG: GNAT family N-acetyltransferase [Chloroflexales bacterium]|nr:GNAT family N-acetyltransferase [Chloroflexales bacterium]
MALHAEALYRYDADGLMLCDNEPEGADAPRFYMHRTLAGNTWRFGHTLPETVRQRLATLCAAEPIADDLQSLPAQYDAIRAALAEDAPITGEYRGPAYAFERAPLPSPRAVLIDATTHDLLRLHFPYDSYPPEAGPAAVAVEDGAAVSCCFCSRLTPRAAHAGLETVEAYRRRGYAVAAVATWAAAVFASGRQPLYSTSWENHASQGVARHFGLRQYGEDWHIA